MSDLIKLVGGIEKARVIVGGAPKWSLSYCDKAKDYFAMVASDFNCCTNIGELRTAIADHDRTDNCVDISNHISPSTKIIEK